MPPPPVQPRPPAVVPLNVPAPPPLNIAPVEKPKPPPPAPPVVASPAPPPPRPTVITQPDWASRPSGDDISRYYPGRAERMEIGGKAEISCQVLSNGKLTGCTVVSEEPADQEFGDAALKLSKLFKMKPQSKDGVPTNGGTVRIPIRFEPAKG
jgi:protein TonB